MSNRLAHDEFLELHFQDELAMREGRPAARRFKSADFRESRTLDGFDFSFNPGIPRDRVHQLATCRFLAEARDVLLVGPPGVGKSHLAQAFGREAIRRAACWAHVRRKFFEGAEAGCAICARLLKIINVLYRIEDRARELGLEPEHRALLRQSRARRVVAGLRRRIDRTILAERPRSPVGKACSYALGQWLGLLTYLDHGDVEIDNHSVENAIRPCALGKKNWLFIGDVKAGPRGAVFYSLLGSCLRRGRNPRAYLHWLFTRIAAEGTHAPHAMTPAAYAALTAPAGKRAQAA
jgi:hypothetical protein